MRLVSLRQRRRVSLAACVLLGAASLVTSANAQEADGESEARQETVVVQGRRVSTADTAIGQGEATNTVAVTRDELLSAPGGISGLKMLESLPGFNVQTDGALGLYEFGNSVTVRAFNLQQIGFVLDGVPMGRSDAFGGRPIFRLCQPFKDGQRPVARPRHDRPRAYRGQDQVRVRRGHVHQVRLCPQRLL